MKKEVTVSVTGAAGQIGYALVFRLASGQVFGPETQVNLRLLELPGAMSALSAVGMELDDCAFPMLKSIHLTSDVNDVFKGSNWAILVGSVPRKEGMERSDLLGINGKVFVAQGKAIEAQAASDVRVFVVGNPCNTNCLITMETAKSIPKSRFFAMTTLDELRAKAQLAQKALCPVSDISNMVIWGNHSATQYPDFYNAKIKGQRAEQFFTNSSLSVSWPMTDLIEKVQKRGAEIIKARGASSAASAANAIIKGINNLITETPVGEVYSMCLASQGEYGVEKGLIFSYPCRTEQGQIKVVSNFEHNAFAQEKIKATQEELLLEKKLVTEQGII